MAFRHGQCWKGRGSQGRADACRFCVVSTLWWRRHQLLGGASARPHDTFFPKHRGQTMGLTLDSGSSRPSSASTPQLSSGFMTCQFTDSTELAVVFAQVSVNKVHNIWPNGGLEHSRQSDVLPGDVPFSESTDGCECPHAGAWRGEGHTSLSLVAPTGKQDNFKLRCRIMH